MRMRQNMIFATIKVVKSWDFQQFLSMGKEQRTAIRRALNEDSEKLIQEGEPNDPQLKRLQREIDEVRTPHSPVYLLQLSQPFPLPFLI